MTTNKPMTGEQLDELMTVAVNMQRDSEKAGERSVAMFAYAVQVAVLELRKVRDIKPADEDHAAAMNSITAIIAILGSSDTLGISEQVAELKAQRDSLAAENVGLKQQTPDVRSASMFEAIEKAEKLMGDGMPELAMVEAFEILKMKRTPATDAFLAEARAQVWMEAKDLAKSAIASDSIDHIDFLFDDKAAQIRKGAQS